MRYRSPLIAGGTFFTVNLADRQCCLLTTHIDTPRDVTHLIRQRDPDEIVAMVASPDHLRAFWRLHESNADFPKQLTLTKTGFSRRLPKTESIRASPLAKRERGVRQRRHWEHQIRDDTDLARRVDDVHFNPVKHGHVERAAQWPYSSTHRFIRQGKVLATWGTK